MTGRDLLAVVEHELAHRGMLDREIERTDVFAFAMGTLLPAIQRAFDLARARKASRANSGP